jgi:hypothetical protein
MASTKTFAQTTGNFLTSRETVIFSSKKCVHWSAVKVHIHLLDFQTRLLISQKEASTVVTFMVCFYLTELCL